ncbi:MAG TPA: glycine cleavage system protein GcvH [Leptospiraceae bacterium]|mgnify:CR=1 FL=1|nr:glycine cleavage system protein H [Spirochaetaceae bacterium]HBS05003.1 glycine cleavage system protein GcvH [Leptospiraceae bacterium]|tara:strand:+ start:8199 stop:8588 length:390 start_codon:yes stop_codon:yes gene_type:complete
MSNIPDNLKYTKDHEWALQEGDSVKVGVTDFAQNSLGDIVYVEVREQGNAVGQGDSFGTIESVKAAEDLYAPIKGTVAEVNEDVLGSPEKVNSDPYGSWLIKMTGVDQAELDALMDPAAYKEFVASLED